MANEQASSIPSGLDFRQYPVLSEDELYLMCMNAAKQANENRELSTLRLLAIAIDKRLRGVAA